MAPEDWRSAKLSAVAQVNPEQLGRRTTSNYILDYPFISGETLIETRVP